MKSGKEFEPVAIILPGVMKEVTRRAELRSRLQAEQGRSFKDEEFLEIAEKSGGGL